MICTRKLLGLFSLMPILTGCNFFSGKDYEYRNRKSEEHITSFMNALKQRDSKLFSSLFCKTVSSSQDFSSAVTKFFQFYQGNLSSYTTIEYTIREEVSDNDNDYLLYFDYHFYVYTDVAKYYIAYYESLTDVFTEANVGIWSLNIWMYDESIPQKMNWYDHEWNDGIHIHEEGNV